jgi:CDP-diglyceride synthetase
MDGPNGRTGEDGHLPDQARMVPAGERGAPRVSELDDDLSVWRGLGRDEEGSVLTAEPRLATGGLGEGDGVGDDGDGAGRPAGKMWFRGSRRPRGGAQHALAPRFGPEPAGESGPGLAAVAPPSKPGRWSQGPVRVATGVAVGVLALILFAVGPVASLALGVVLVTLAAAELFGVLRQAGYRPATLVGLVATVCIMVAGFEKGQAGLGVVVVLTIVVTFLWYLLGVERSRPTVNLGATLFGFLWVGLLGSYGGLLLSPHLFPHRHGIAFLLGAAVAAVAYDVGALLVGSRWGRHQMAGSISPNKTWEGLMGGTVACLIFSVLVVGRIHPWDSLSGLALGLLVSVVAPLGDLCESMIKRDLGIKDMGFILPGHGGVLDRVDALLFVLPATFYLVRVLNLG